MVMIPAPSRRWEFDSPIPPQLKTHTAIRKYLKMFNELVIKSFI